MPAQTEFFVKYICRHQGTVDLSDKLAGKRAGYARWLAKGKCPNCWRKENQKQFYDKDLAKAEEFAARNGLPALEGSEAQLRWAPIFRSVLLQRCFNELVRDSEELTEDAFVQRIIVPAAKITRAGWWMDNKESESDAIEELVTTALDDDREIATENPF